MNKYHVCSLGCVQGTSEPCVFECGRKAVKEKNGWDKPMCHDHMVEMDERFGKWEAEQIEMHAACECECAVCNPDDDEAFDADA
jgi:hypothetical protein